MSETPEKRPLTELLESVETRANDAYNQIEMMYENPEGAEGELSDSQLEQVKLLQTEYQAFENQINSLKTQLAIESRRRSMEDRVVQPVDVPTDAPKAQSQHKPAAPALELGKTRSIVNSPTWGFLSTGHWVKEVALASGKSSAGWHENLRVVRGEQREGFGTEGGFLVPTEMSESITRIVLGDSTASLAARCRQQPISGNTIKMPLNMSLPYDASGAIKAYWGRESGKHRESQTTFEENLIELGKITSLVYVTDELLEDAPAIGTYVADNAPTAIAWEIGDAIINGDGVGKPLGIMNSKAVITIAKESNQTADTIVKNNIFKAYSAMPAMSQANAVIMASPTAQVALWDLVLDNRGDPGRGMEGAVYSQILSRPIIQHLALQPLGDKGDILIADFSKYDFILKGSGVRSATSMHMKFDEDVMALKFSMRCNGQPSWNKTASVPYGNHKLAPFVVLAAR